MRSAECGIGDAEYSGAVGAGRWFHRLRGWSGGVGGVEKLLPVAEHGGR